MTVGFIPEIILQPLLGARLVDDRGVHPATLFRMNGKVARYPGQQQITQTGPSPFSAPPPYGI